jgi:hypothetical protein
MDQTALVERGMSGQQELTQVLDRVKAQTEGDPAHGVVFIKSVDSLTDVRPEAVRAANAIYDDLSLTLGNIAEEAFSQATTVGGSDGEKYAHVLKALEPVATVCRALADNGILLIRDIAEETRYSRLGDQVSVYKLPRRTNLDGVDVRKVEVAIRENRWQRPKGVAKDEESAQPKLGITIVSGNFPYGEIRIRIDREGLERGLKTTYDVIVGPGDKIAQLAFPNAGQREGHHFDGSVDLEQFKTSFPEVLAAYDKEIARRIARRGGMTNRGF